ncbi:chemotaxis protein CheA [Fluviispira sanaruensis]|uniref:Chemotaxis protein CheA n=1 Tax=Fluviispira sanaruensis TaxID=2493639 RepID=A0A4P2VNG9_FLUSA|nr:chemotaxis protein CheA [Fluviispira sanaruensis]BBH53684.1 chemotaxis protein CheA [Fluviispira sanaruensis]
MDEDFELELRKVFLREADINLEEAEEAYLQFSQNPPSELLARCFRLAHNLKGSAKAVGFSDIAEILHRLESFLLKLKNKELNVSQKITNILLATNDKLKFIVEQIKINTDYKIDTKNIIAEIDQIQSEESGLPIGNAPNESQDLKEGDIFVLYDINEVEEAKNNILSNKIEEITKQKINTTKKIINEEVIRVSLNKIEKLQNYIGEIVIIESMLEEQIKQESNQNLKNYYRLLKKTTKEVQEIIMGLRLVPIKPAFQKLLRTARDTSAQLGKTVNVTFVGENTELDKFILDELSDPLMHMIRNAIDHGIEDNDERVAKEKMREGNISVNASHESGNLVITVADDGKGLNPTQIYESAVKKGVISEDVKLTDSQCYELIFAPGFSTKTETTEISGRGVGMDVVKTNIEKLNRKIEISSVLNMGTNFKIKIPLSVGIMEAFIAEISNQKFIIPVQQVIECLSLRKSNLTYLTGIENIIKLRDEEISVIDLSLGLNLHKKKEEKLKDRVIFIVQANAIKIGAIVDKVISIQSVVTKNLGEELRCESGIIGSVILGDGKVVPILEISQLVNSRNFQNNLQKSISR